MKYVGLTNEPAIRCKEHGAPPDWWAYRFDSVEQAQQWCEDLRHVPGYSIGRVEPGSRFGYTFTMRATGDPDPPPA